MVTERIGQKLSYVAVAILVTGLVFPSTLLSAPPGSPVGAVKEFQKISDTAGNFTAPMNADEFGASAAAIGDFDGDGIGDVAVGANKDWGERGAVYILLLNADETVKSYYKLGVNVPGSPFTLLEGVEFGSSVASLGDLDGDGVIDLAIGAPGDSTNAMHSGALYIVFLNADGTVKAYEKIVEGGAGFTGDLGSRNIFGMSVANLGDLDSDGVVDLAVGAPGDVVDVQVTPTTTVPVNKGAVYVLFMNDDGTVKTHQKINELEGGFTGVLGADYFGMSVTNLGDFDNDGVTDLGVGATLDDTGGPEHGAWYLLYLNSDGTVQGHDKITNFSGIIDYSFFGSSAAAIGDFDGDGVDDFAVSAYGLSNAAKGDAGNSRGEVFLLYMNADGTLKTAKKLLASNKKLQQNLAANDPVAIDMFGTAVVSLGDVDGNGIVDLFVGASHDDDGGGNHGGAFTLYLK